MSPALAPRFWGLGVLKLPIVPPDHYRKVGKAPPIDLRAILGLCQQALARFQLERCSQ
jgi:hypothetical protein